MARCTQGILYQSAETCASVIPIPAYPILYSLLNVNCLRISNELLKYRTQWLCPPEAMAARTRARNAVNESPGRGWARFDPGNDFLQIMENFLMKAARRCPFEDLETRRIYGPNGCHKFCSSRRSLVYRMHNSYREISANIPLLGLFKVRPK